ncbi:ureidoglycolate hydrolase [Xylaria intraflava]|nr:ureidoglycolate hydrolase [Xylaria intraflava]
MLVQTISLPEPLRITALPLTREAFAPFGQVIANPRPGHGPANTTPEAIADGILPYGAISTNQGTAIQYRDIASMRDLYDEAPSAQRAGPRMTMFVCGARTLVSGGVKVQVLERHPFTSQTFIPLTADGSKRYLVVVAPTAGDVTDDQLQGMPAPHGEGLPGRGLPALPGLKAFLATGDQAVTYGAGTWHAPMIALGPENSTVDFVVVQFANGVPVEDCQEIALEVRGGRAEDEDNGAAAITVHVPEI